MGHSLTPFERYLRIAGNTSSYKFDTLVRARDFFRAIPLGQRTSQISRALASLSGVVDGRYDAPVYAHAVSVSENIEGSTPLELVEAERVLKTISVNDASGPRH